MTGARRRGSPWWETVLFCTETGCWEWLACKDRKGYGSLQIASKLYKVHRLVWEELRGPISHGLVIDHLCRNTACCNPAHLEPVEFAENVRRGKSRDLRVIPSHCGNGHEYAVTGTVPGRRDTHLVCAECARERSRKYRALRREGAACQN